MYILIFLHSITIYSETIHFDFISSCSFSIGETLSDVLPGDIYRRLKRHLDYVKLMMPSWMKDEHRGLYAEYLFKAIAGKYLYSL